MRSWLSVRLIRLGRRIDPAPKVENGTTNVFYVSDDPADRARRIQETIAAVEALNRRRSVLPLHLR